VKTFKAALGKPKVAFFAYVSQVVFDLLKPRPFSKYKSTGFSPYFQDCLFNFQRLHYSIKAPRSLPCGALSFHHDTAILATSLYRPAGS
jgi:hypothetical protein